MRLELDGPIATITNARPEAHNAFDDAMDQALFSILGELVDRATSGEVRAVIWRAEGPSFSAGRDRAALAAPDPTVPHGALMRRGHRGIQQLFELDAPVLCALKGWVIGGSFQRALLCDIRVCATGTRFRLPELAYGVIPDTGGVAVLHAIAGAGLVNDLVLSGRVLDADDALTHGVVSRVVPEDRLDEEVRAIAEHVVSVPFAAVRMAREVVRRLSLPAVRAAMADEQLLQTWVRKSDDLAEQAAARSEGRPPRYRGF